MNLEVNFDDNWNKFCYLFVFPRSFCKGDKKLTKELLCEPKVARNFAIGV